MEQKYRSMPTAVRRRTGTGSARVLGFLLSLTFAFAFAFSITLATTVATAVAVSLTGKRQALQFAQVHARQANGRFEVFAVLMQRRGIPEALGLLR